METILIAGAGERGIQLYYILKKHDVNVDAFLDNNQQKQSELICGICCYPINHFEKIESECVVYVSPENCEELYGQIRGIYSHVVSKKVIDLLFSSPFNVGYKEFINSIGHFYSAYPEVDSVINGFDYAMGEKIIDIKGINFNEEVQVIILKEIITYFDKIPQWGNAESDNKQFRFILNNPSIPAGDAVSLFALIQIFSPKKVIEVGSGYSSAMFLDVNDNYFENKIELIFIEPFPNTLRKIKRETDNIVLEEKKLQEIPLDYFDRLDAGDILFIDSTHVSKEGSDVNYLFFEILPILKSGVIVHFHDIFYPFTYPHEWIEKGRVWNEAFLLRAFLEFNNSFEVIYCQNYIQKKYKKIIEEKWNMKDPFHGASFWIRKK